MSSPLPMSIALSLAGVPGVAASFTRHEISFTGVRRMFLMAACSGAASGAGASALKDGVAAIKAVAAAPIMAFLRTLDTVATRDLLGNPFVIRTSPNVTDRFPIRHCREKDMTTTLVLRRAEEHLVESLTCELRQAV